MKFGVFSLMEWPEDRSQSDAFREELDQLTLAEQQGYDSIWLAEPHFSRCGIGPAQSHRASAPRRKNYGSILALLRNRSTEAAHLATVSLGPVTLTKWGPFG